MVLTLELPIRQSLPSAAVRPADPCTDYVARFGALPAWFDEISASIRKSLARRALREGVPLSPADFLS